MKRAAFAALILLLLAGCAAKPPSDPYVALPSADGAPPDGSPQTKTPGPVPAPDMHRPVADGVYPAAEVPFTRAFYRSGEPVPPHGVFFMKTATGEIEGWTAEGELIGNYAVSTDNRWVSVFVQGIVYLADRKAGNVVARWDLERVSLLAAQGDRLLLANARGLQLVGPDLRVVAELTVPAGRLAAAFSADGRRLAVLSGSALYLADAVTGEMRPAATAADLPGTTPNQRLEVTQLKRLRQGAEVGLLSTFRVSSGEQTEHRALLQRFDWSGAELGRLALPAGAWLSPDGSLVAGEDVERIVMPVVVLADAGGEARLRAVNVSLCSYDIGIGGERWLSDSSGLVVRTADGYRLLTADGALLEMKALAQADALREPIPAPDRPDLFAIGRAAAVTAEGIRIDAAHLNRAPDWVQPGHMEPWGDRSDELRFTLPHHGHGPRCTDMLPLPPKVETAPFAAEVWLAVTVPAGDCLNLRAMPSRSAAVRACLPGGTRLTVARTDGPVPDGTTWFSGMSAWADDHWWIHVRTESGQRGWVVGSPEFLDWAP
jgi:hypothetical protein